ncbi:MAG: hypothetical protein AMS23_10410 [Bacteroides sp. SM1_62]|nr:MAG: hypothetical protein AMS26_24145 [Bacteroides sp. SM23_62]KPL20772.1 MAG: hypothetical protein AMS23_10410 [Bacteroides sp. SM1_62]
MENGFLEFVYDFYKSMKAHEIKLVYEGRVTQQITKTFIALAESHMEENAEVSGVQRKVVHVMVECLQNISRYADEYEPGQSRYAGRGIFMVSHTENYWCVTTGNAIFNEKVKELRDMIDQINELNEDELKDLYVKQMREGRMTSRGGAGLGFIDIRRKTKRMLEYYFLPITEKVSFFLFTTFIPRKV